MKLKQILLRLVENLSQAFGRYITFCTPPTNVFMYEKTKQIHVNYTQKFQACRQTYFTTEVYKVK